MKRCGGLKPNAPASTRAGWWSLRGAARGASAASEDGHSHAYQHPVIRPAVLPALAAFLIAQEPRFDARSSLVLVPVTVTDSKGGTIDGLEAQDFLLFDNGR